MKNNLFFSEILNYICNSKYTQTLYTHNNKCMEKNRIEISVVHKKELQNKHRTSMTTVQLALDHYNNSPLAQAIRKSAKKLLLEEVEKIQD